MSDSLDYEELSSTELTERIKKAELVTKFEKSEDWKLIRESLKRMVDQAQASLVDQDPNDIVKVARHQTIIRICGNFIQSIISMAKQDGELAAAEEKERSFMDKVGDLFKK